MCIRDSNYIGPAVELDPEAAADLEEAWSAYEKSEQERLAAEAEADLDI